MKKLLLLILCIPSFLGAQNSDLIKMRDQELPKISSKVPSSVKEFVNPDKLFEESLRDFTSSMLKYNYPTVRFAAIFVPFWQAYGETVDDLGPLRAAFFKNRDFWEPVYQMTMPIYQKRLSNMPLIASEKIVGELEKGLEYAKSFDLKKEKAYLDGLGEKNYLFKRQKGKMNAFIYRRIANKEMSKAEVIKWMERIIKDFKAVIPKAKEELDNYIIFRGLYSSKDNDYYWGYEYQTKYDRENRKHMLFKKEGDNYLPLSSLEDQFEYKWQSKNQPLALTLNKKNGTKGLYLFSKDEASGKTRMQAFGEDKGIKDIFEFSGLKALKLVAEDGSMDILYNLQKEKADIYPIQFPVSIIEEFKELNRYFILSAKGGGLLLKSIGEKDELKFVLEEKLPEAVNSVARVLSTNPVDPFGTEPKRIQELFKLKSADKTYLWQLDRDREQWTKITLEVDDFSEISILENGNYLITKKGKTGILDKKGKIIFEPKYIRIIPVKDNFVVVSDKEKAAFFDAKGKALTDFKFDAPLETFFDPETFEESMQPKITVNEKSGMVTFYKQLDGLSEVPTYRLMIYNEKGEEVIPPKYDYIGEAYTDKQNITYYIVSKEVGEVNPELEQVPPGKYGVINSLGKRVIPFKYTQMDFIATIFGYDPETFEELFEDVEPHFIANNKKGKTFYFNLEGKKIENPIKKKED